MDRADVRVSLRGAHATLIIRDFDFLKRFRYRLVD